MSWIVIYIYTGNDLRVARTREQRPRRGEILKMSKLSGVGKFLCRVNLKREMIAFAFKVCWLLKKIVDVLLDIFIPVISSGGQG